MTLQHIMSFCFFYLALFLGLLLVVSLGRDVWSFVRLLFTRRKTDRLLNIPADEHVFPQDPSEKEYKRLYLQLKEQHAQLKSELENVRKTSFHEQLRAETFEKKADEMELLLTDSSASYLQRMLEQFTEEYTQSVVTHHRDMVEYEQMIQSLLVEIEKASRLIAQLEKKAT